MFLFGFVIFVNSVLLLILSFLQFEVLCPYPSYADDYGKTFPLGLFVHV